MSGWTPRKKGCAKIFGSGRKKGTPNKISLKVRDDIVEVFTNLGGVESMTRWAKKHQTDFYKIYSNMVPRSIQTFDADNEDIDVLPMSDLTDEMLLEIIVGESTNSRILGEEKDVKQKVH